MSSPTKKTGLGKGLSALMGESYSVPEGTSHIENASESAQTKSESAKAMDTLPIGQLQPGKYQPRHHFKDEFIKELAQSIEKNGIMQPLIVRPLTAQTYEIIAGERRFRAAQLVGLSEVPVVIRKDVSDQQALELALIENIQRKDLSAIEEADGYQQLIQEFSYSQEELAKTVGKSRSHITNLLRLLKLPDSIKALVNEEKLSMGHARALLGAPNAEKLAEKIIAKDLSVRHVEELVRNKLEGKKSGAAKPANAKPKKKSARNKDADVLALEESLSQSLNLPVSIEDFGNQSGEITLHYSSLLQLDNILQRLNSEANF